MSTPLSLDARLRAVAAHTEHDALVLDRMPGLPAVLRDAAAALTGRLVTQVWQEMVSALKDGTEIIVRVKRAGCVSALVVHWMNYAPEDHPPIDPGWYFWSGFDFRPVESPPIAWMVLPPPPPLRPGEPR